MPSSSANESPVSQPTAEIPVWERGAPFALTIFFSAFLLFQVQPLIAKQILPWFGGSAAVWTTCMLFFQIALLLGYSYAHWLTSKFDPRRQMIVHAGLLCLSLVSLPIIPNAWWKPSGTEDPLLGILGLLAATIGLPYFLLSSTSPLLQAWMARAGTGAIPYRFFALSNLGSMLALLSYPVLVEPTLTNKEQAWSWSIGYGLFAALCGFTAFRASKSSTVVRLLAATDGDADAVEAPARGRFLLWIALSASASALLLSVTTHITENVASIPFLWILPLALYLLTFILCFEGSIWYQRIIFLPLFAVSIGALAWGIGHGFGNLGFREQIAIYTGSLFVCCMVCHGELSRTKPAARYLTGFYLMVSVGGAIGGLFVAFLAPHIFNAFYEFPIAIAGATLAVLAVYFKDQPMLEALRSPRQWIWLASFFMIVYLGRYLYEGERDTADNPVFLGRNFYGALRVNDTKKTVDQDAIRSLTHGTINHGDQFLDPVRRHEPTTYYGHETGIGRAIDELQATGPLKVGVVGLGTGTIAAYSRPFDTYRYYEINPLVLEIAHKYFFYLDDSKAKLDVALGDARLTLEREQPQNFDILAVDAFSSDSIPVHLLTNEAFKLYWKHMKPNGILAIHISNRYLDLGPVVEQEAKALGKPDILITSDDDEAADTSTADWVLVSTNQTAMEHLSQFSTAIEKKPRLRMWTDDYSNLWQILK
jgi:SAM-dependent methyltransferase